MYVTEFQAYSLGLICKETLSSYGLHVPSKHEEE